ncbi:MAG: NAD(P)H:quinone oxidoreductase [Firmicutes bacterium]|nr:NAD(P)H:quinone oxidoreductase [Bacillota bacterium]
MALKLAVIYYSSTGTNYQLAKWAQEAGLEMGAEVRLARVPELAPQTAIDTNPVWKAHAEKTRQIPLASHADLEWADAYIFSMPSRFGMIAAQMRQFLDTTGGLWARGKLANKAVSAMTSAQNTHGGQEATILSLYNSMLHWGAIVAAPGYTNPAVAAAGGNPYGTSVTAADDGSVDDEVKKAVQYQVERTLTVARWIKDGRNS